MKQGEDIQFGMLKVVTVVWSRIKEKENGFTTLTCLNSRPKQIF